MTWSVALTRETFADARKHLVRLDKQEDICFALWNSSRGTSRTTGIITELILPRTGERIVKGNAAYLSHYFERAIFAARAKKQGLALMHSHPNPGFQILSKDDRSAESDEATAVRAATGYPYLGLTMGSDGYLSARFWIRSGGPTYEPEWAESVRIVGDWLDVMHRDRAGGRTPNPRQTRTVSAWGPEVQEGLSRLRVGIVGLGSVGSQVAEAVARMGIARIRLMDYDRLELRNLDRTLNAYVEDVGRPKVLVSADSIRRSSTADDPSIEASDRSIGEELGFRSILDCDVVFCCVDRPMPRFVLNFVALAHLIPVIDGGISIERRGDGRGVTRADWRAHAVTPTRACLECLGQYDPGDVQSDRDGQFEDPGYIRNLPPDHPAFHNENVFGFALSASSFEILQFLSLVIPMPGLRNPGAQTFRFVPAWFEKDRSGCKRTCFLRTQVGLGDSSSLQVAMYDKAAAKHRGQ